MKVKIYILMSSSHDYDLEDEIIGVFSTLERAQKKLLGNWESKGFFIENRENAVSQIQCKLDSRDYYFIAEYLLDE